MIIMSLERPRSSLIENTESGFDVFVKEEVFGFFRTYEQKLIFVQNRIQNTI